jgi:hypothetical protein
MIITLTADQLKMGAETGIGRRISALKNNRSSYHGYKSGKKDGSLPPWELDVQSSCAELAVAIALDKVDDWVRGVVESGPLPDVDILPNIQVRYTERPDGRLIIYKDANPKHIYFLAIGETPTFEVKGYVYAKDAMEKEYWWEGARSPAYFFPQHLLSRS